MTFRLSESIEETEDQLAEVLEIHHLELEDVFNEIKGKEEEYK